MNNRTRRLVSAVLFSGDASLTTEIRNRAATRNIAVQAFSEPIHAMSYLTRTKVEAVMLDWTQQQSAATSLGAIRASSSNHNVVVIAFTRNPEEAQIAKDLGASFNVDLPLNAEVFDSYLRVAYGFMVHELRRYFRFPISIPVEIRRGNAAACGRTINISMGGMAIAMDGVFDIGDQVEVMFRLPTVGTAIHCSAEVCWTGNSDRIGLRFVESAGSLMIELQQWLASRLERYCEVPAWNALHG